MPCGVKTRAKNSVIIRPPWTTIKDNIQVAHRPIINGFQIDLQSDCIKQLKKLTTIALDVNNRQHVSTFRTNFTPI